MHHARDAAYDIVLLAHVLAAVIGFGVVAVAGSNALALRRPGPRPEALRRYYRPGVNWAARSLFVVPLLGVALVAMSGGDWSYREGWVLGGLALWALAALLGELVLWPGERALQEMVARPAPAPVPDPEPVPAPTPVPEPVPVPPPVADSESLPVSDSDPDADLRRRCLVVAAAAGLIEVALVAASVIMVAKP